MRILTISSLFPRRTAPHHGVFVHQRMRAVAARGAAVRVVSPLPWVPPGPVPASYARIRATPGTDRIGDIPVRYPRYFMVPKLGMRAQWRGYARAVRRAITEEMRDFRPDVIDAHYLYPDACGVARVARESGIPYVCSARGSDVKLIAHIPWAQRRIRAALAGAAEVIAVSQDLAREIAELRLRDGPVRVIPNGIDPERFRPVPKAEARRELEIAGNGRLAVCVANLVEEHGQKRLVEAMAHPGVPAELMLYLVGDGPDRARLERAIHEADLGSRVRLAGPVPHERVPYWFSAADFSILLSDREGCPNVVLESLACGTPCLASNLPEMREVIHDASQGMLVGRTVEQIAGGLARMADSPPQPVVAGPRTWDDVAAELLDLFEAILGGPGVASARGRK